VNGPGELGRRLAAHTPGLMCSRNRYAMLCPFVERQDGLYLLFEVRAATLRRQPGEVCFPGGRMETGESPEACALRETGEELHIAPEHIELWGRTDFIVDASNAWMQPVAGKILPEGLTELRPSRTEVEETFLVPLSFFREHAPHLYHYDLRPLPQIDFPYEEIGFPSGYAFRGGQVEVPIWQYNGRVIWGLTARIIRNILQITE
jgi:coenzyme A diphosphatase NUDT7